jgi:hypothetical protein
MRIVGTLVLALLPISGMAQQEADEAFHFDIAVPAFGIHEGPNVCFDEAHHNFHTADGRYAPFARLLRADGFAVSAFTKRFSRESLATCDLLVVANALAKENQTDWSYPHPSAFTKSEIRETMEWIRAGGRLLLFADHAPMAAAARDLGSVLGIVMIDAYVTSGPGPDLFRRVDDTLRPHPVVSGRGPDEDVDSVATFTGQAIQITQGWEPLLVFGSTAKARLSLPQSFQQGAPDQWPAFSVAGWVHGAARKWDNGRIVFLGEAAMCTAQIVGPLKNPMGMNHPLAQQNAQFCINVARWLTGALD